MAVGDVLVWFGIALALLGAGVLTARSRRWAARILVPLVLLAVLGGVRFLTAYPPSHEYPPAEMLLVYVLLLVAPVTVVIGIGYITALLIKRRSGTTVLASG